MICGYSLQRLQEQYAALDEDRAPDGDAAAVHQTMTGRGLSVDR